MTEIPKFTNVETAIKFLNDSDLVTECVPCFVLNADLNLIASAIPGDQGDLLGSLRILTPDELLAEANKTLNEIIPFITVPDCDIADERNDDVVRLLDIWFKDWR